MKTINIYRAQILISRLELDYRSALLEFEMTGVLNQDRITEYHSEIEEMLSQPHYLLQKQIDGLHLLKNYFNKFAPLPKIKTTDELLKEIADLKSQQNALIDKIIDIEAELMKRALNENW
jgi:methyl coenzyme M reductase subunit C-like uncharacterized protein (methanogenesis marker protein 7)